MPFILPIVQTKPFSLSPISEDMLMVAGRNSEFLSVYDPYNDGESSQLLYFYSDTFLSLCNTYRLVNENCHLHTLLNKVWKFRQMIVECEQKISTDEYNLSTLDRISQNKISIHQPVYLGKYKFSAGYDPAMIPYLRTAVTEALHHQECIRLSLKSEMSHWEGECLAHLHEPGKEST